MVVDTQIPEGYKSSDLGIIPSNWDVRTYGDICVKIQDGTHFSPKLGGRDYRYVTSRNIRFGFFDVSNTDWINFEQHKSIYKRCDVKFGDVLLTKDGASTGNAALNHLREEFSILSSIAFLRFDANKHSASFYLQQILSWKGQQQMKQAMSGNAITRLTLEKIKRLKCIVPPLSQQTAIAKVLSETDELISELDKLIEKKKAIKKGVMQELLTGERRLPGFSGEWRATFLGDVVTIIGGGTPSSRIAEYWNGEIDWFTPTEVGKSKYLTRSERKISEEGLKNSSAKILPKGTVLLTSRAGIGDLGILINPACTNQGFQSLVPSSLASSEFIYYMMHTKHKELMKRASGSTFLEISPRSIKEIQISIPDILEQDAISSILAEIDNELFMIKKQRLKYQKIKQGMMQQLLTGKIRLV